jgi:hypothetical protein
MMTPKIAAPIIVVAQLGSGIPLYMFAGQDIIDAIAEGYLSVSNDKVWLTEKGQTTAHDLLNIHNDSELN